MSGLNEINKPPPKFNKTELFEPLDGMSQPSKPFNKTCECGCDFSPLAIQQYGRMRKCPICVIEDLISTCIRVHEEFSKHGGALGSRARYLSTITHERMGDSQSRRNRRDHRALRQRLRRNKAMLMNVVEEFKKSLLYINVF